MKGLHKELMQFIKSASKRHVYEEAATALKAVGIRDEEKIDKLLASKMDQWDMDWDAAHFEYEPAEQIDTTRLD
jgi:hypothetical protein